MKRFTDNQIKNLKPEAKTYRKTEGNGFYIRVTPKGKKAWLYRYHFENKDHFVTLGYYPSLSLSQARIEYQKLHDLWQSGVDPKSHIAMQAEARTNTVKKLVEGWYTDYILRHRKRPEVIKQLIDADIIPLLGNMELANLSPAVITKALDKIVNRKAPVQANKVLSALKQAFSYGVRRGAMTDNPAESLQARDIGGIEKPRDRYLTITEIRQLLTFLQDNSSRMTLQVKNAIKIMAYTGIRSGELRLATWDEIDFKNNLWTIPKEHTKQNEVMRIHLAQPVSIFFTELQEEATSKYILSAKGDKPIADKTLSKAIARIQERVGIPHWTAHDLRRTFATQLGETLLIDPVVIEKCLGHKMPKIMATYNKNEMLPQRKEALTKWASYLDSLLVNNVLPINKSQA